LLYAPGSRLDFHNLPLYIGGGRLAADDAVANPVRSGRVRAKGHRALRDCRANAATAEGPPFSRLDFRSLPLYIGGGRLAADDAVANPVRSGRVRAKRLSRPARLPRERRNG